jgi:hypothetical protein
MNTKAKDVVRIDVTETPQEVGKAVRIAAATEESYPQSRIVYIPISCIHEIHPDNIVMDKWMANVKNLVY